MSGRWWPSPRGLTGFASAVLRALFDGFDGIVYARGGAAAISQGGYKTDGIFFPLYQQTCMCKEQRAKSDTWKQTRANMRASVCMRVRVRVRARAA